MTRIRARLSESFYNLAYYHATCCLPSSFPLWFTTTQVWGCPPPPWTLGAHDSSTWCCLRVPDSMFFQDSRPWSTWTTPNDTDYNEKDPTTTVAVILIIRLLIHMQYELIDGRSLLQFQVIFDPHVLATLPGQRFILQWRYPVCNSHWFFSERLFRTSTRTGSAFDIRHHHCIAVSSSVYAVADGETGRYLISTSTQIDSWFIL